MMLFNFCAVWSNKHRSSRAQTEPRDTLLKRQERFATHGNSQGNSEELSGEYCMTHEHITILDITKNLNDIQVSHTGNYKVCLQAQENFRCVIVKTSWENNDKGEIYCNLVEWH